MSQGLEKTKDRLSALAILRKEIWKENRRMILAFESIRKSSQVSFDRLMSAIGVITWVAGGASLFASITHIAPFVTAAVSGIVNLPGPAVFVLAAATDLGVFAVSTNLANYASLRLSAGAMRVATVVSRLRYEGKTRIETLRHLLLLRKTLAPKGLRFTLQNSQIIDATSAVLCAVDPPKREEPKTTLTPKFIGQSAPFFHKSVTEGLNATAPEIRDFLGRLGYTLSASPLPTNFVSQATIKKMERTPETMCFVNGHFLGASKRAIVNEFFLAYDEAPSIPVRLTLNDAASGVWNVNPSPDKTTKHEIYHAFDHAALLLVRHRISDLPAFKAASDLDIAEHGGLQKAVVHRHSNLLDKKKKEATFDYGELFACLGAALTTREEEYIPKDFPHATAALKDFQDGFIASYGKDISAFMRFWGDEKEKFRAALAKERGEENYAAKPDFYAKAAGFEFMRHDRALDDEKLLRWYDATPFTNAAILGLDLLKNPTENKEYNDTKLFFFLLGQDKVLALWLLMNRRGMSDDPLCVAIENGYAGLALFLLDLGFSLNRVGEGSGLTAAQELAKSLFFGIGKRSEEEQAIFHRAFKAVVEKKGLLEKDVGADVFPEGLPLSYRQVLVMTAPDAGVEAKVADKFFRRPPIRKESRQIELALRNG
jgi:hypothetical protein